MLKKILAVAGVLALTILMVPQVYASDWVSLPTVDNVVSSSSPYATGAFNALVFLGYFILGIFVGVAVILLIIRLLKGAVSKVAGGRKKGRRRRR